jgi:hypothetical protein
MRRTLPVAAVLAMWAIIGNAQPYAPYAQPRPWLPPSLPPSAPGLLIPMPGAPPPLPPLAVFPPAPPAPPAPFPAPYAPYR